MLGQIPQFFSLFYAHKYIKWTICWEYRFDSHLWIWNRSLGYNNLWGTHDLIFTMCLAYGRPGRILARLVLAHAITSSIAALGWPSPTSRNSWLYSQCMSPCVLGGPPGMQLTGPFLPDEPHSTHPITVRAACHLVIAQIPFLNQIRFRHLATIWRVHTFTSSIYNAHVLHVRPPRKNCRSVSVHRSVALIYSFFSVEWAVTSLD